MKKEKWKKTEGNPSLLSAIAGVAVFIISDVDCNIHSSHCGYKSATPLEVAWNALVTGKSDTDLRVCVTWDVASVTNLIIYADTLVGANIEVRPDKSERNALCQVRRLNTAAPTKGIRS